MNQYEFFSNISLKEGKRVVDVDDAMADFRLSLAFKRDGSWDNYSTLEMILSYTRLHPLHKSERESFSHLLYLKQKSIRHTLSVAGEQYLFDLEGKLLVPGMSDTLCVIYVEYCILFRKYNSRKSMTVQLPDNIVLSCVLFTCLMIDSRRFKQFIKKVIKELNRLTEWLIRKNDNYEGELRSQKEEYITFFTNVLDLF